MVPQPGEEVAEPADLDLAERQVLLSDGWPKMAFIEERLAGDPTNWWVPNHACLEAMLRDVGLAVESHPMPETYLCVPARAPRRRSFRELARLLSNDSRGDG